MRGRLIESSAESWLAIGYVCLFPSLVAYLCFNRGVELIGSAAADLFLNIMPIIGALPAALFLDEAIQSFHLAGGAVIAAGLACAAIGSGRRGTPPPAQARSRQRRT